MGLEDRHHATIVMGVRLANRGCHFGRMVRIVVDDGHSAHRASILETSPHTLEPRNAGGRQLEVVSQLAEERQQLLPRCAPCVCQPGASRSRPRRNRFGGGSGCAPRPRRRRRYASEHRMRTRTTEQKSAARGERLRGRRRTRPPGHRRCAPPVRTRSRALRSFRSDRDARPRHWSPSDLGGLRARRCQTPHRPPTRAGHRSPRLRSYGTRPTRHPPQNWGRDRRPRPPRSSGLSRSSCRGFRWRRSSGWSR